MRTALDTNVLIAILTGTSAEIDRAERAIGRAARDGTLVLPMVCYAELASRFRQRRELDSFVASVPATVLRLDVAGAYPAGIYFREYRRRGGPRTRILGDFLIAAQAQVQADRLLTSDKRFFSDTFPELVVVSPEDLL